MLADALRAETYRLSKNRTILFWSVLFVPVISLMLGSVGFIVAKANMAKLTGKLPPELLQTTPLNLGDALVRSAADFANPAVLMFVLIGAATLYAGDYRWETWRLTSARNTRPNLLAGKVLVLAGLAFAAMAAVLVFDLITSAVQAAIFGRRLAFSLSGGQVADLGLFTLLAWARIIQFTMLSLLAGVVTRSLLAALFAPMVIGVGQFFMPQILTPMGVQPDGWLLPLLSPSFAHELLKSAVEGGESAAGLPPQAVLKGMASLALWTLVPLAAAIAWFNRQDLSKE